MVAALVQKSGMKMMTLMGDGHKARSIFDQKVGLIMVDAAKIHTVLFTMSFFEKKVKVLQEGPLKVALRKMNLLFAISELYTYTKLALETDSITNIGINFCQEIYEELLDDINVDA